MTPEVLLIEQVEKVKFRDLPNGEYKGAWGGSVVDVEIAGNSYRLLVDVGNYIRTPCKVIVSDGSVTIRTKQVESEVKLEWLP